MIVIYAASISDQRSMTMKPAVPKTKTMTNAATAICARLLVVNSRFVSAGTG